MYKTIIFDLDGTIADSEPVFFRIVNDLAPLFGYAPITTRESNALRKLHLRDFFLRRLGWRIILLPFILSAGRKEYRKAACQVSIFPGIKRVFTVLHKHGIPIGIVSSSEEETIRTIIKTNGLAADFIARSNLFGKARVLKKVLRERSLATSDVLYVGDEIRDVEACHKAHVKIIAVTWGLNTRSVLESTGSETVESPEDLLGRILT